jgi:hypothetical protein
MNNFLFLPDHHLLVVEVVGNVNFDTKLLPEFVDACTLRTYDTPNILLVDVKFGGLEQRIE